MANNPLPYDAASEAAVNAFCAAANGGTIVIYSGTQPTLNSTPAGTVLATLAVSATAFANSTATSGTVTAAANSITSATAVATATAAYFVIYASNGTTVVGTGTVGTTGCDLNLNTTSIVSGATVSVTAFSVTMAES